MKSTINAVLFGVMAITGCSESNKSVEVHITAESYRTGDVQSKLATPVVDEVVRINPKHVLMLFCSSTPPAKVSQFLDEVRARTKAEVQGTLTEKNCST